MTRFELKTIRKSQSVPDIHSHTSELLNVAHVQSRTSTSSQSAKPLRMTTA